MEGQTEGKIMKIDKQCKLHKKIKIKCRECFNKYHRDYYHKHLAKEKERKYKSNYNLTFLDVEMLLTYQNNTCAICKKPLSLDKKETHVDHCHKTKEVRGILCVNCNRGLGYFKDEPDILKMAIKYLSTPRR